MRMISTIVIAAAGRGTRMGAITTDRPKHLLSIHGHPFFYYILRMVRAAGFTRIIIVTGYHAEKMKKFLEQEQQNDTTLCVQTDVVGEKMGTAAVVEAAESVIGQHPFVFMNGDSLYEPHLLQKIASERSTYRLAGQHHDNPSAYGVVEMDDQRHLHRIVEKPRQPTSSFINLGVYALQPDIFPIVKTLAPSPRGEYELTDAINIVAQTQPIVVEEYRGRWVDLGKPEDIPRVEKFIEHHRL